MLCSSKAWSWASSRHSLSRHHCCPLTSTMSWNKFTGQSIFHINETVNGLGNTSRLLITLLFCSFFLHNQQFASMKLSTLTRCSAYDRARGGEGEKDEKRKKKISIATPEFLMLLSCCCWLSKSHSNFFLFAYPIYGWLVEAAGWEAGKMSPTKKFQWNVDQMECVYMRRRRRLRWSRAFVSLEFIIFFTMLK